MLFLLSEITGADGQLHLSTSGSFTHAVVLRKEDAMDTDKDPMEVEASHNGLSSNPTLMSESSRDGYLHSIRILRAEFTQKVRPSK